MSEAYKIDDFEFHRSLVTRSRINGNRDLIRACRKFCVGQSAWVDWPSESFVEKDRDRQTRGLPVGGLDKKHLPLHVTVSIDLRRS